MKLGHELKRLARHSVIYGLGGFVSRILATLLLPLYTHYLPRGSYGRVEIVTAATAVLAIVLQMGIVPNGKPDPMAREELIHVKIPLGIAVEAAK